MIRQVEYRPVPGIPRAPITFQETRNIVTLDTNRYLDKIKKQLEHKVPWLTREEIINKQHKYHVVKLHELMVTGYFHVAQKVRSIIRFDQNVHRGWSWTGSFLTDDNQKIDLVIKTFKKSYKLIQKRKVDKSCIVMKRLGQKFLRANETWLAIYIFHLCLKNSEKMENEESRARLQAELHCLLAFLEKPKNERLLTLHNKEQILQASIAHLTRCQTLSKLHKDWILEPNLIRIDIETPLHVQGLATDILKIQGNSMSLSNIAALLEQDLLIGLADATLKTHYSLSKEDYLVAKAYADQALQLAFDVKHPVAVSSAILRCALLESNCHKYDEALALLTQLITYSELHQDVSTKAIGLHNIGRCLIAKHAPIEALENFVTEKEISDQEKLKELEANSIKEIGRVLLTEGQLWESEESFRQSHEKFSQTNLTDYEEETLVFSSIAAGQHLYSRLVGLARSEELESCININKWKTARQPLPVVNTYNQYNDVTEITEFYDWGTNNVRNYHCLRVEELVNQCEESKKIDSAYELLKSKLNTNDDTSETESTGDEGTKSKRHGNKARKLKRQPTGKVKPVKLNKRKLQ